MTGSARRRRRAAPNASELHRSWLELVDRDGPFLAVPPLKRVWPNGIPDLRSSHPDRFEVLGDARKDFEAAWELLDRDPEHVGLLSEYRTARDKWVETVLREVAGWAESLQWGAVSAVEAQSPNRLVSVTAQAALAGDDGIGALVHVCDPVESLRDTPSDGWSETPVGRLDALLRENDVEIGIVTDGRWWGLVCACSNRMSASGVVDALTWTEEPRTRDAFLTLIGRQHIIGGDPAERLPALFEESVAAAEEITEALGAQVRSAVELLIQSFSESAIDVRRLGRPDPLPVRPHDVYEAAVTVMMRVVFLLFAEERGLLPSGELFEQGYGISSELDRLTAESADGEEALDATYLAWHRLLATSRALHSGATFESLRMPAYGGSLFDPDRFGFLTATSPEGTLAVPVADRVMLHVLRSVQVATVKREARRVSFRDIDVEQIGYIYEGLLGYTCERVDEPVLGLLGKSGAEPEIPLADLERLAEDDPSPQELAAAIQQWVKGDQPAAKPATATQIAKAIEAEPDPAGISALAQIVGDDLELRERITPWLGLVRRDLRGHPLVILEGGLLVSETPSRRNAGAHYTPKSLAEEVVLHALEPLCYSPGPYQTAECESWRLRSADEILDLKVADIACGSGAFLVAAARYLADRVVEAWMGEGLAVDHTDDLRMLAIRKVVASCLYGADINEMAVEMCKLSLWLVSLDRNLPFSFVDDKIFVGNSLLGITSLDQLRHVHIDPSRVDPSTPALFDPDIEPIIQKAADVRRRLTSEIDNDDPARSGKAKSRQLERCKEATEPLRRIADGIIAAGLPLGGKPGRKLDAAYGDLRVAVTQAYEAGLRCGGSLASPGVGGGGSPGSSEVARQSPDGSDDRQTTRADGAEAADAADGPATAQDASDSPGIGGGVGSPDFTEKSLDGAGAAGGSSASPGVGEWSGARLDEIIDHGLTPTVETDYERWQPLHWVLEAPDIFIDRGISEGAGGFDAIVGNPPFLGGQHLSGAFGGTFRDWLVAQLAFGKKGSADLVAYFLLRANSLLRLTGSLGLLATNTVAQGATREVGLDQMDAAGFEIVRAIRSRPWPTTGASLECAAVWGTRALVDPSAERVCDGLVAKRIGTLLEPTGTTTGRPFKLADNAGVAFQGCVVLGSGFIIEADEAAEWIEQDPCLADVLFRYMNGDDLNGRPDCSASRWVIDFYGKTLEEAQHYQIALDRIASSLEEQRERSRSEASRKHWWQFLWPRPKMRAAIGSLEEVLAIARVSMTLLPARVPTGQVFDGAMVVFTNDSYALQASLSSSSHQHWVTRFGSTMGKAPRYTPSDVFETFPRPEATERLDEVGRKLEETRKEIMLRRELGLTKLYNLINDPKTSDADDEDVACLRAIHTEIDEAVMEAYGWSDVPLDHGFHEYRQMVRWTVSPAARVEILDRLLEENHRRASLEAAATPTRRRRRPPDDDTELPFS